LEDYRRSRDDIPSQSKVVRDALDEFLPELENGAGEAQEGVA